MQKSLTNRRMKCFSNRALLLSTVKALAPVDVQSLRDYLEFCSHHRQALCTEVEQSVPAAAPLFVCRVDRGSGSGAGSELRADDLERYGEELAEQADRFTEQGGTLSDWLRAGQIARRAALQLLGEELPEQIRARSVLVGLGLFLDIVTVSVGRQAVLRQQLDARFRLAFESAPTGMAIVDQQGVIAHANVQTERLFGYAHGELVGQPIEILVPSRRRDLHRQHRAEFSRAPTSRMMGMGRGLYGLRKDGSEFPVEIGLNPSLDGDDGTVLAVIADISERKRAQEALVHKMGELQRSNEELEQFAYVASHDLQEPLRMVVSYTMLLSERYRGRLDEKADKFIRYAVEGATRLQQLVADLLAYSRVGSQGRPLKPVSAQSVFDRTLDAVRRALEESHARITCGPLPAVIADEVQLAQLFQNLLSNALKFRGTEVPLIQVAAQPAEGFWQFSIKDNGIGIEPEHSARIFQMFQRLHERGKYEGNGIGLAIAKKIVERHHGRIWFESLPGQGTTFFFTLPAAAREGA